MNVTELLRTLKYGEEEIKTEKGRVEEALRRCKLVEDGDIEKGISNLKRYLTTEAAYRVHGIALKRFTDMMLAKDEGKKLVYLIHEEFPQIIPTFYSAVGKEKLVIEIPETIMWPVFDARCFNKVPQILECGEKHGMEITAAHCPIDKVAMGAIGEGVIPKPDFLTSGGVFCDQGPKQCEVMGELFDIPYFVITDSTKDEPWGLFPDMDEANAIYLGESIERHFKELGRQLGAEVTAEDFHKGRVEVAKLWAPMAEVHRLVSEADPRPTSANDDDVFYWMTVYPDWRIEELSKAYHALISEIRVRVFKGEGVIPKGAPRTNFFCDPRPDVVEMCEKELGINIVIPAAYYWIAPFERIRKFPKEASEFVRFAEAYMKRGLIRSGAWEFVCRAKEYIKEFKLDGYMSASEYGCRPLCWPGHWVKEEVERELGIPVIYFEHSFDPRSHTPEQLRTKIETFASLMRIRKRARARAA
ncbi:MAG: 2-hydroxyacyl-CoA dehydratase family protein [Chloroflexota bacterium]